MSKARVAVMKIVSKQLTVSAAAAEYGFSRRHLHRLLARYRAPAGPVNLDDPPHPARRGTDHLGTAQAAPGSAPQSSTGSPSAAASSRPAPTPTATPTPDNNTSDQTPPDPDHPPHRDRIELTQPAASTTCRQVDHQADNIGGRIRGRPVGRHNEQADDPPWQTSE